MARRTRTAPARRDGPESDARRHAEATTLYNDLVVCQTRDHAIELIDRALLLARIAGSNAYINETSRRERLRADARRAGQRRSARDR